MNVQAATDDNREDTSTRVVSIPAATDETTARTRVQER